MLHHLPDPEAAFQTLPVISPQGEVQIFVLAPEGQPIKRALLSIVWARVLTTARRTARCTRSLPGSGRRFYFCLALSNSKAAV